MYAFGSRRDMGTLVAPIGSATVAMPAAARWTARHAVVVLPARLSIVEDYDELVVKEGDQDVPAASGAVWRLKRA